MTQNHAPHDCTQDYVVRIPRPTDSIGHTLRGAFGDSAGMPEDFNQLLKRLQTKPRTNH